MWKTAGAMYVQNVKSNWKYAEEGREKEEEEKAKPIMEHSKWNATNIGSLNSDNFFCVLWGRNGNRNAIANKHIPLPISGINVEQQKNENL